MQGLGLRVGDLGSRVEDSGLRGQGLGLRVNGFGFGVDLSRSDEESSTEAFCAGLKVGGLRSTIENTWCRKCVR